MRDYFCFERQLFLFCGASSKYLSLLSSFLTFLTFISLHFHLSSSPSLFISLDLFSLPSSPPLRCCCDVAMCVAMCVAVLLFCVFVCVCVVWLVGVVVWLVGVRCVLCVVVCRCVCCVWCVCGRGVACVVWHAENPRVSIQNASVYIQKRPRVYRQHAHTFFNMCAWCRHTRRRFECTHGGVLDGHTAG